MIAPHFEQPAVGAAPDSAGGIFDHGVDTVLVSIVAGQVCREFSVTPGSELAKTAIGPDKVLAGAGLQESVHRPMRKSFRHAKVFEAVTIEPR